MRDLENRYASAPDRVAEKLDKCILATSLRFAVLCRFSAYIAIDSRVVADRTKRRPVLPPVKAPDGWQMSPFTAAKLDYSLGGLDNAPRAVHLLRLGFPLSSSTAALTACRP
jgi:hypothetical protein